MSDKLNPEEREILEKFEQGEGIEEPASQLREKIVIYRKKIGIFVTRMTRIFLNEEIERAVNKTLDGLTRELKQIRRKDHASIWRGAIQGHGRARTGADFGGASRLRRSGGRCNESRETGDVPQAGEHGAHPDQSQNSVLQACHDLGYL